MSKTETLPGIHTVATLLNRQPERVQSLWLEQNKKNPRVEALISQAKTLGIAVQPVQRDKLDKICEGSQHQGIAAVCLPTPLLDEFDLLQQVEQSDKAVLLLVLDEVSDPQNLGAILRTADAAGVDALLMPQRNSAPLTPAAHKIACGGSVTVPIVRTTNLARHLEALKKLGVWLVGANGESDQSLYKANLSLPTALVMGAEGQGLRRLTRETCDHLCALPMSGVVESLNVSTASALFLYEAVRQRQN
ncbi:MAG: 23S rRNA (guanosine(2251)-2'-O)-methyltransferase RlmB [Gammaproteobacteria bacterium]|nr:23S rRNA (guanosine(2251)-2'-O)-methyltransferase RlmB [Gammaproteobacteria bacterium]